MAPVVSLPSFQEILNDKVNGPYLFRHITAALDLPAIAARALSAHVAEMAK